MVLILRSLKVWQPFKNTCQKIMKKRLELLIRYLRIGASVYLASVSSRWKLYRSRKKTLQRISDIKASKAKAQGFALGVAFALENNSKAPDFWRKFKIVFNHFNSLY